MRKFEYAGKSSADFGFFISGSGVFGSPEPDLEYVQIPGRNGDLIYDNNRFSNIDITYPGVFSLQNFVRNYAAFKEWLYAQKGYNELTDDYQPDYYRMASVSQALNPTQLSFIGETAGGFDLVFNCKPQLFLKAGKHGTEITSSTMFINPTGYTAKPLLDVYGYGTVTVGSRSFTIASNGLSHIMVDCELQDCYLGSDNANPYVTIGDYFPELGAGSTTITFSGNVTKIIVYPRWWTI